MHIRQLETFVAIHDQKGFKRAANVLNMTPSAVSMQIRALEAELNSELFDRRSRPPALNGIAQAILQPAREIIGLSENIRRIAGGLDQVAGKIVLGVIPSATVTLLPEALAFTARRYPQLQVRVIAGLTDDLTSRALSGELDAALVTDPPHRDGKLRWSTVMEERFMIVCHRAVAEGPSEETLRALPFIRFNRNTGIGWIVDRALQQRRIAIHDSMELDSIDAILTMVAHGHGTAVVPEFSVFEHHRRAILVAPFGAPPATRRIALAMKMRADLAPLGNALLDGLRAAATKLTGVTLAS